MRLRTNRGFTLVELTVVIAIIGVLAGIAVPMFMTRVSSAKATEATLQLEKIGRNATLYFQEHRSFPPGVAAVLPGPDGSACSHKDRLLPASRDWNDDPSWSALDMVVGEKTRFSYHFESMSKKSAHAWAVADFACNGNQVVYHLYLEGRSSGHVEHAIIDPLSKYQPTRPAAEGDDDDVASGGGNTSSGGGDSTASGGSTSSGEGTAASGSTGTSSGGGAAPSSGDGAAPSSGGGAASSSGGSSSSGSTGTAGGSSSSGSSSGTTVTVGGSTTTVCVETGNSGNCKKTK